MSFSLSAIIFILLLYFWWGFLVAAGLSGLVATVFAKGSFGRTLFQFVGIVLGLFGVVLAFMRFFIYH